LFFKNATTHRRKRIRLYLEGIKMTNYGQELAKAGLTIKAIKLNPEKPFLWASGYHMPIYNDNRMFLFFPEYRKLILKGFEEIIKRENIKFDIIAGTSTAGIPHGALLADKFNVPFIYIRDKPKAHGLKNQIEGVDAESDLKQKSVIVIEDLISTGGSSARAVQAVRDANGVVDYCISIFNYGLDKAASAFNKLNIPSNTISILTYDVLLNTAKEIGYMSDIQINLLKEWKDNPFGWGEKNGFHKVNR
jgi:orotate phosphoribosyltransferase